MLEIAEAGLEIEVGFVHVKGTQARHKPLGELVDATDRRSGLSQTEDRGFEPCSLQRRDTNRDRGDQRKQGRSRWQNSSARLRVAVCRNIAPG